MKKVGFLKKAVVSVLMSSAFAFSFSAEENGIMSKLTVNLTKIQSEEGEIIVAIYNSSDNYDNGLTFQEHKVKPVNGTVTLETHLPDGEYLVMLIQDLNMNGKLDTGFMGIPKEPVGISNYEGKGIPGRFKKHKFSVNGDTEISIPMKYF